MYRLSLLVSALLFCMTSAHAYVGPGAGLGAVLVAIALVLGLLLLVVGFVWFPIKRMLKAKKSDTEGAVPANTARFEDDDDDD